jgi:hypothetical protein
MPCHLSQKNGGRKIRPPRASGLLVRLVLQTRSESLEDERVRLIGEFGHQREVVPTEAVRIVVLLGVVHVGPSEGHVVELGLVGFVFPNRGFDPPEAECCHRWFGAGGGVLDWRGRGSGFSGHIVSFVLRSGIALSTRGGGAGRNEGTVGGIPFKEDPNVPCSRSDVPAGGTARESKDAPLKRNVPLCGCPLANTPRNRCPSTAKAGCLGGAGRWKGAPASDRRTTRAGLEASSIPDPTPSMVAYA